MHNWMLKTALTVLLTTLGSVACADDFSALLGLESLHDAKVVTQEHHDSLEKIYPQGSVRRISGKMRYSGEVLVRGSVDVLTVQLASTHDALDAFSATRKLLQSQHAEMLYWCAARECGPSNLWANQVFANARLYGPDDRQAYALFRLGGDAQSSLMAVYAITRGNGRGFLHVEQFQAEQLPSDLLPTATTLERQLRTDDQLFLPRLTGLPDSVWTQRLVRALNQNSTMRVSMAGEQAQAWRDAMVDKGVRASRIELEADYAQPGLLLQRLP
ncbi:DUF4892 domain-containing protein [Denitrificimonas caeni]|uniref:DUF4892 domain-containing protein n=1 Tax=Denitrificimonas caeni TaxID=521720 RepID=UPI0019628D9C|nr:DUF4892 domain-containing protein [Denitrificimonas caeni]